MAASVATGCHPVCRGQGGLDDVQRQAGQQSPFYRCDAAHYEGASNPARPVCAEFIRDFAYVCGYSHESALDSWRYLPTDFVPI